VLLGSTVRQARRNTAHCLDDANARPPDEPCAPALPQTFQKLIFVSNLVFGDQKAAFLLPWRRTFKLTDSQLAVAKRDSAKALFKSFLDERGGFQVRLLLCVLLKKLLTTAENC